MAASTKIGKRGRVVIHAAMRRRYGLEEGSLVIAEPTEGGIYCAPLPLFPLKSAP